MNKVFSTGLEPVSYKEFSAPLVMAQCCNALRVNYCVSPPIELRELVHKEKLPKPCVSHILVKCDRYLDSSV